MRAECLLKAARGGDREVLEWLHNTGCPWDPTTCWMAARAGNLDVLQWARARGCPWNAANVVRPPLGPGTCACCSGRGSTTARGTG